MFKMLKAAFVSVLMLTMAVPVAQAVRDPGSYAFTQSGRGPIQIDANVIAPESCYAAVSSRRDGSSMVTNRGSIIPVTIVLDRVSGDCVRTPTVVRSRFAIVGDSVATLIEIKFVTASGSSLKTELISISGR